MTGSGVIAVFPFSDAQKRLQNCGPNDFRKKVEEHLLIRYLSGVSETLVM